MADPAPVTCSDDGYELAPSFDRSLPVDRQGRVMTCYDAGHGGQWRDRHRCARCGQRVPDGRRSYMAVYCTTRCRVAAHRARNAAIAS